MRQRDEETITISEHQHALNLHLGVQTYFHRICLLVSLITGFLVGLVAPLIGGWW